MASIAYEIMTAPVINKLDKPKQPTDKDDKVEAAIFESEMSVWTSEFKKYRKKKLAWENRLTRMFNLTLQHFTPELKEKLKITNGYNNVHLERGAIGLLGLIRDVAHDHTDNKNKVMVCVESSLALYMCTQGAK